MPLTALCVPMLQVAPHVVMAFLNELFTTFDKLCDVYRVQKVETAGDWCVHAACWE